MSLPHARKSSLFWPALALALVTAAAFSPVCTSEFLRWDDPHNLSDNPDMNPPTLRTVARYWTAPYKDLYAPLTYTAWSAAAALARMDDAATGSTSLNPYLFHTLNLSLHIGASLAALALLRRLLGATWPAWCGAMVFALHPVQVESVAWISGMKDVLAGLLGLTSARQYLAATERPGNWGSNSPPSFVWHRYALALALAALAMLSKPSAVALPLVLIAIDVGWRRYPWRISLVRLIPFFVLAVPVIAIGKAAQPAANLDYVPPVYLRPLVAIDAIGFYLGKTALPIGLGIDYGRSPRWLFQTPGLKWAGLIAVMACAFAVAAWRRWRAPGVGLLLFTAALLPTLGLIPFDYQAYSTVADHYLYLAMIGPGLVAGTLLLGKPPLTPALPRHGVAAVAIIAMAWLTFAQTRHWRDSQSLFRHTLRVNPASLAANVNLGNLLAEQGQTDEAIACFRSAIATAPEDYHANLNLANMLRLKGMLAEAEDHYRKAANTRLGATSAQTWTTLGAVQAMQKRYDDAIESFQRALSIDPAYGPAKQNLDLALKLRPITPATRPS